MKNKFKILMIFTILIINNLSAQTGNKIIDARDGKEYKWVKIGEQVWMAQNLNFQCNGSNCYLDKEENCKEFGRLYNLEAAKSVCPAGWHLPSDIEWQEFEKYLGMSETDLVKTNVWRGTNQGKRLVTDTTISFQLLYGGYRNPPSNYNLIKMQAFYWTSSEVQGSAWYRQLYEGIPQIFRSTKKGDWSFSVRCVKDLN
jgi:uncharacterized protein (TIGR02145 family)